MAGPDRLGALRAKNLAALRARHDALRAEQDAAVETQEAPFTTVVTSED
ncbi:MAG: hypothetical protein ACXVXI_06195 [Mycobacteriaceae bacterium]